MGSGLLDPASTTHRSLSLILGHITLEHTATLRRMCAFIVAHRTFAAPGSKANWASCH